MKHKERFPYGPRVIRINKKQNIICSFKCFAGMGFKVGDRVCMFVAAQKVAIGSICEVDPDAYCSGVLIREGHVSVSIELCLEKKALLPFPTMDALTVGDAFHSIVRWSIGSLHLINEMQQIGLSMSHGNAATGVFEGQYDRVSYREVWKDRKVQLWNESRTHVMAEGVVMYVYPFDSVNFKELGEDNIGIGIETSYGGEPNLSINDVCSINLVSWPIKRVTTMDGKSLLQYEDLSVTYELHDISIQQPDFFVEPISKKRKYFFVNRKPKMSIKPSKKVKQVSLTSIQLVATIDCCAKRCCQHAN